jgi:catechol 2,3-dioxygenase-like lactoylglutathione lyase family enzyme
MDLELRLEVVILPVSDVDASKAFYEKAGFVTDTDHRAGEHFRVVQLTPPGSACSVTFGVGMPQGGPPGSVQGLHLVTPDLPAAREALIARGVEVSEPFHFGPEGQAPGLDPNRADYGSFASFSDPDGNGWLVQEVSPDR